MLKVDLSHLASAARLEIDTRVPASDPLWEGTAPNLVDGLHVRAEVRRSGDDVLVRGTVAGSVDLACRRCLRPVRAEFVEPVTILYRPATDEVAGQGEVYVLPERGRELDLGPAIREHALLAAPQYVLCRASCAGLCPQCGTDLNGVGCDCRTNETDERWAALRRLRPEG